jgi:hypothetical protein
MKLARITKHENCAMGIKYETNYTDYYDWLTSGWTQHFARLVCVDPNCKHKKKYVKFLNEYEHNQLVAVLPAELFVGPPADNTITLEGLCP